MTAGETEPGERPRASRRRGRKLLIGAAALVLACAGAEAYLRCWQPIGMPIFELDEELLFTHIPNARSVQVMDARVGGDHIPLAINGDGLRGPRLTPKGARARIAVFGDSLVFAANEPFERTFGQRLEAHLERLDVPAQVLNAGVTGYGPDQTLLKLRRELASLEPDFVVHVVCATNDFGDLVRNKLFSPADAELERNAAYLGQPVRAEFAAHALRARRPALLRAFERMAASWRRPAASRRDGTAERPPYIEWYLAGAAREHQELAGGNLEVVSLFNDYYDADIAIHPQWPSSLFKRELMTLVLREIGTLCAAQELPLLTLIVPSAVDLSSDFEICVDSLRYPTYDPQRLTNWLEEILIEADQDVMNLYASFEQHGAEGLFVGHDDFHWNAAGQDLAARQTAERLAQDSSWR